jgi:hypothetical protein
MMSNHPRLVATGKITDMSYQEGDVGRRWAKKTIEEACESEATESLLK